MANYPEYLELSALFDTAEDAIEAWNKRYKED